VDEKDLLASAERAIGHRELTQPEKAVLFNTWKRLHGANIDCERQLRDHEREVRGNRQKTGEQSRRVSETSEKSRLLQERRAKALKEVAAKVVQRLREKLPDVLRERFPQVFETGNSYQREALPLVLGLGEQFPDAAECLHRKEFYPGVISVSVRGCGGSGDCATAQLIVTTRHATQEYASALLTPHRSGNGSPIAEALTHFNGARQYGSLVTSDTRQWGASKPGLYDQTYQSGYYEVAGTFELWFPGNLGRELAG
jgi:hypothetical protein